MTIIADAFARTDQLATHFVIDGYSMLARELSGAVYAGFTLYVIVMGLGYLRGVMQITFADLGARLLKGAIIVGLALNWGLFAAWVYTSLAAIFNQLGGTLLAAFGAQAVRGNMIEDGFLAILDGTTALMDRAIGIPPDLASFCSGLFLLVGGVLLYGYAAFILLFSKVAFAITIVLAPLFIPFAFFEATKMIFGAWVRTVGGFVLIPVLATGVNAFALAVLRNQLTLAATGDITLVDAGLTLLMCVVFAFIMKTVPQITGGMMGSVAMVGAGAMASMFIDPLARGLSGVSLAQGWLREQAVNRYRERMAQRAGGAAPNATKRAALTRP